LAQGLSSGIQTQLNGKQATNTCITLTGNQTLGGNITCTANPSSYTFFFFGALPLEIAYLSGVSSAIQTQLNRKQDSNTCITLTGNQTLGGDITCTTSTNNYKLFGATPTEIAYVSGVISAVQTQLNGKLGLGVAQILTANITAAADTYMFWGAKPSKIAYVSGVTSAIQTQLNGKQASGSCITLNGNQTLSGNIT